MGWCTGARRRTRWSRAVTAASSPPISPRGCWRCSRFRSGSPSPALPSPAVAIVFLLLVAPLPIAAFLSRTGRYEIAQLLSSAALATLVAWLAAFTGGMTSPVLAWLVLVPAEAGLAGSRRVMVAAAGLAGGGARRRASRDGSGPAGTTRGAAGLWSGGHCRRRSLCRADRDPRRDPARRGERRGAARR